MDWLVIQLHVSMVSQCLATPKIYKTLNQWPVQHLQLGVSTLSSKTSSHHTSTNHEDGRYGFWFFGGPAKCKSDTINSTPYLAGFIILLQSTTYPLGWINLIQWFLRDSCRLVHELGVDLNPYIQNDFNELFHHLLSHISSTVNWIRQLYFWIVFKC